MASAGGLTCQYKTVCRNSDTEFNFEFSISGIDWVSTTVASTGRPSVASMSIQGGAFDPVDQAVTNVITPFFS